MKKKFFVSLLLVVMVVVAFSTVLVACNKSSGELLDYTVTVTKDDLPVSDITVNWCVGSSVKGSAKTGSDGKATVQLEAGTYDIKLLGYEEGYTYSALPQTATSRRFTIKLVPARMTYSVTIIDKDNHPANGITVNYLDSANAIKGTAVTGADGKASCELNYGTYKITLGDLPDYNVWNGTATVSQSNPNTQIRLVYGNTVNYSVTVRSQGGLLFKNEPVIVFDGEMNIVSSGYTSDKGVFAFRNEAGNYTVEPVSPQEGYTFTAAEVSDSVHSAELVLTSKPIDASKASDKTQYVIGDIIHDYTFTTSYYEDDGETIYFSKSISQIFAEGKKAIIINNWGTQCTYCVQEMPAMQKAYELYGDDIELIGLNNYMGGDSISTIESFVIQYGYTFPLMRDANKFADKLGIGKAPLNGWPVTVVIDRYGAIARIESGAIFEADNWGHMIQKYISDDYVQDFVPGTHESDSITSEMAKPNIKVPDNHYETVADTINADFNAGMSVEYFAYNNEYAWPFILDVVDGVSENGETVLYSSNSKRASSFAAICANVTAPAGKVLTFDYYTDTEENCDIFQIFWDGMVIQKISGQSNGWKTCYLYVDLTDDTHTLIMAYVKDESSNKGKDAVYIKNVRFTEVTDMTGSADMLRSAAYGTPEENDEQYPYYAGVELGEDDYYYVKLNTLQNSGYAGNDNSPLLLINLLGGTKWDPANSLYTYIYGVSDATGEYIVDCNFPVNGVTKDWRETLGDYLQIASSSDIYGYVPVDKELHDILVEFMKRAKLTIGATYHENEWLETCYFYSHYGDGEPVGNPIMGITEKTALPIEFNTVMTANLTRFTIPFPFATFYFIAPADGLYKIESFIPDKDASQYASQIWLYDDSTSAENPYIYNGDERFIRDGKNEQNFEVYRYMRKDEKYYIQVAFMMQEMGELKFKVSRVNGDTATALVPCSSNLYTYDVDDKGNVISNPYLKDAIEYGKGDDGFYRVKNSDDQLGDFIYIDVDYATSLTKYSISQLIEQELKDPIDSKIGLGYGFFDFRYMINYIYEVNDEGKEEPVSYDPKADLTSFGPRYKDYTQFLKDYIADSANAGPEAGLLKVTDEIVDIFTLFYELRVNLMKNGQGESAMENEWLRFCWYYKTYDQNNA